MPSNGNSLAWKVITVCIVPVLFFMGKEMIANEEKSQKRDAEINVDVNNNYKEQQKTNELILVALAEIKTDLKYIKKNVKNGNP